MSTHEAIAALPVGANADAAAIRAMCTRRFAYVLAADEPATSFVAADPATGVIPQMLFQNNVSFLFDSTDSTTAHDGVTCLVSSDGKRFKSGTIAPPYSVLDKDLVAQPASPSVGDRYLIPAAATGTDWAGQDGKIGMYTSAGWRFAISPIGRLLHVEDETAFYHRDASGVWTAGLGSIVLAANSVPITAVLGAKASFVVKVENQTTNAPPASPVAPVAYIIGPSPTGAWAGNAGKLAVCLADGAFTIITPDEGDAVWDKATNKEYYFNGTAWASSAGAWIDEYSVFTAGSLSNSSGTGTYTYSNTVAPSADTSALNKDNVGITWTARATGAKLCFHYEAVFSTGGNGVYVMALLRDSVAAALDWISFAVPYDGIGHGFNFEISAPDALEHTYYAVGFSGPAGSINSVARRRFSLMEAGS